MIMKTANTFNDFPACLAILAEDKGIEDTFHLCEDRTDLGGQRGDRELKCLEVAFCRSVGPYSPEAPSR